MKPVEQILADIHKGDTRRAEHELERSRHQNVDAGRVHVENPGSAHLVVVDHEERIDRPRLLRHGREVEPVPVLVTPVRHGDDLDALVDHVVERGGLDQILVRRRYLPDVRSPLRLRVPQLRDGGEAEVVEDDAGPTAEVEAGSKDAERLTRGEAEGDLARARVDELGERGAQLLVPGDPRIPR